MIPISCALFALLVNAAPAELSGTLAEDTTLSIGGSPYRLTGDLVVPAGVTLTVDPGVEIRGVEGADLTVGGALTASGTATERIRFTRDGAAGHWHGITIEAGTPGCTLRHVEIRWTAVDALTVDDTGDAPVLLEDAAVDAWGITSRGNAVDCHHAHGLVLRRSTFGLDTPDDAGTGETIHASGSRALIEYCTFAPRSGYNDIMDISSVSVDPDTGDACTVRYNTFLGGTDDAIDYDGAEGWIVGNLIMNFQPPDLSGSPNGGGITGDDSRTVVLNNTLINCYHAIGYKNGSEVFIAGNTIVDCHVGITLYRSSCGRSNSRAAIYNTIVWNAGTDEDGETPLAVVLDGRWWPGYCREDAPHATIDVYNSIIEGGWLGTDVRDTDPLLADPAGGDVSPTLASPAVDAGHGGPYAMALGPAWLTEQVLADAMARDGRGAARLDVPCVEDAGTGAVTFGDIGAVEFDDLAACGAPEAEFLRGDGNDDGRVDISDAVFTLLVLFAFTPTDCADAADANDDGALGIADPVYLLTYLYAGGGTPPPPWREADTDPTDDELGCERGIN
jgi:hypothetical protein